MTANNFFNLSDDEFAKLYEPRNPWDRELLERFITALDQKAILKAENEDLQWEMQFYKPAFLQKQAS